MEKGADVGGWRGSLGKKTGEGAWLHCIDFLFFLFFRWWQLTHRGV